MNTNKISLIEFLKKYTAINNKFINEYYSFYIKCEKNTYGILLDDIIDYLKIKNHKFVDGFKKKYTLNIDYIKITTNTKKVKGQKYTLYYTNLDTFERICMSSKAEKANDVRDYFITLRKFIQYYKDNIANMINQTALKNPNGYIYILLVDKTKKIFKVGKTENMKKRLQTYATGSAIHPDIKFIMLVKDRTIIENCVKSLISKYQYKPNKEIYKVNISVIKDAIFNCSTLNAKYDQILKAKNVDSYIVFDDAKNITRPRKSSRKLSRTPSRTKLRTTSRDKPRTTSRVQSRTKPKTTSRAK